jgi:CheY-like chemotaxis protein
MARKLPKLNADERPNTIGLPSHSLDALLDGLDAAPQEPQTVTRRQFARWPFRLATIHVAIIHPGGSMVSLKLACRNLSRGGISLLHNSFVHPGSPCRVELPTLSGRLDRLEGVIQRCAHRRGTLHELGIQFRHPIEMTRYVERNQCPWTPSLEQVAPDRLVGTVVYAEPSLADLEAFQFAIKDTSIRLRHVRTGAEVLAQPFPEIALIVSDLKLPDMSGSELLSKLRAAGCKLPILLLSGQRIGAAAEHLQDANCALVQKPVPAPMLLCILAEWTLVGVAEPGSSLPGTPQGPVTNPPKSAAA